MDVSLLISNNSQYVLRRGGLLILAVILMITPKSAAAFDFSGKDSLMVQIQVIQQEIQKMKQMLAASRQSQKAIGAAAYIAVDLDSGNVLLQKNAGRRYPIASITKLMAAVVTLENINIDNKITITQKMLQPEGYSPAIFPDLTISAKNLLNASLIQSTNDAAESLSYFLGKEKFIGLMNARARTIGMAHTFFADTCGLDSSTRSTASDLAKLLVLINKNHPEVLAITKNNDFWMADASGKSIKFQNMNDFYSVSDFVGGKTGYTPEARQTFASVFKINGRPTAIIILASGNYRADTFKIMEKVKKNDLRR